jgi:hypothetical protein
MHCVAAEGPELYYYQQDGDSQSFYTLFPEKATARWAQKQCSESDGMLATISSDTELARLSNTLLSKLPREHKGFTRAWLGYSGSGTCNDSANDRLVGTDGTPLVQWKRHCKVDGYFTQVETSPAREQVYIWMAPENNLVGITPGIYLYTANATSKLPFICKSKSHVYLNLLCGKTRGVCCERGSELQFQESSGRWMPTPTRPTTVSSQTTDL